MRKLVLYLMLFFPVLVYSKEGGDHLESGRYNFVEITVTHGSETWPLSFCMLFPPNDTIRIEEASFTSFVSTLLEQGCYVPNMAFSCPQLYRDLFDNSPKDYEDGILFVSDFNLEFDKHKELQTIHLNSGECVSLAYVEVKGFFYIDNEHAYCFSDSNGLDFSEYDVKKCIIPVSYIHFDKANLNH